MLIFSSFFKYFLLKIGLLLEPSRDDIRNISEGVGTCDCYFDTENSGCFFVGAEVVIHSSDDGVNREIQKSIVEKFSGIEALSSGSNAENAQIDNLQVELENRDENALNDTVTVSLVHSSTDSESAYGLNEDENVSNQNVYALPAPFHGPGRRPSVDCCRMKRISEELPFFNCSDSDE